MTSLELRMVEQEFQLARAILRLRCWGEQGRYRWRAWQCYYRWSSNWKNWKIRITLIVSLWQRVECVTQFYLMAWCTAAAKKKEQAERCCGEALLRGDRDSRSFMKTFLCKIELILPEVPWWIRWHSFRAGWWIITW